MCWVKPRKESVLQKFLSCGTLLRILWGQRMNNIRWRTTAWHVYPILRRHKQHLRQPSAFTLLRQCIIISRTSLCLTLVISSGMTPWMSFTRILWGSPPQFEYGFWRHMCVRFAWEIRTWEVFNTYLAGANFQHDHPKGIHVDLSEN